MLRKIKPVFLVVPAALVAVFVGYWLVNRGTEHTDDATLEAHVTYMAPKLAGYVAAVAVEDNQEVAAGDLLLRLDPRDYEIALQRAKAQSAAAAATVAEKQADADRAQRDWNRSKDLNAAAVSPQRLDELKYAADAAQASLLDAQAKREAALADEAQAANDLAHVEIRAPYAGRVTKRSAEPGSYVQPGQSLLALVSDEMWVVANFKESQIAAMRPGQAVDITIDAQPGLGKLTGKVQSIQRGTGARFSLFPPENATGNFVKLVQRVPVKIVFDTPLDPALPLGPGLSVIPVVHVGE